MLNIELLNSIQKQYNERIRLIALLKELSKDECKQSVSINLNSSWSGIFLDKEYIIEQVKKNINEIEFYLMSNNFELG